MADDFATGFALGQDGGSGGGFGSFGEGLWAIIILAMLGFGRGGFGGFGGGGEGCASQADVRAAVDQQTLISKLDAQTYGIADSTYALNNTIVNGFHGVDNAICSIGHQISDCCCTTQRSIDGLRYDMATQACDTRRAISDGVRDIIDNQNCNTRSIMDFMVNSKIEALQAENNALRLSASQAKQNQYLIDQLRPCPVPAYITCNPYAASWGSSGSCGCGC